MVKELSLCKHCKKEIRGEGILVGLNFICPYCRKPSEEAGDVYHPNKGIDHRKDFLSRTVNL